LSWAILRRPSGANIDAAFHLGCGANIGSVFRIAYGANIDAARSCKPQRVMRVKLLRMTGEGGAAPKFHFPQVSDANGRLKKSYLSAICGPTKVGPWLQSLRELPRDEFFRSL